MSVKCVNVSVIIPSYKTPFEQLKLALHSVLSQSIRDIEVLIIDDNDSYKESRSIKKVIKALKKEKLPHFNNLKLICNNSNLGLVESRRIGILSSSAEYVFFLDSDDVLSSVDAIKILYETALKNNSDIVQCAASPVLSDIHLQNSQSSIPSDDFRLLKDHPLGCIKKENTNDFCKFFMTSGTFNLFLWAKLIKKSVLLSSIKNIPFMNCFLAEDFLFSYFISRNCLSYYGIKDSLYDYRLGEGISTSTNPIDSIQRWQKICSVSCVFTTIFEHYEKNPIDSEFFEYLKKTMTHFAS